MKMTSLCYIEKDGCYLMLHRIKKEDLFKLTMWEGDKIFLRFLDEESTFFLLSSFTMKIF